MGAVMCVEHSPYELQEAKKTKEIDQYLKKERKLASRKVKLLLLGAGDSGKSTFLKQLKLLHKDGFGVQEVLKFQSILQDNCLFSMQRILMCEAVDCPKKLKAEKDLVMASSELSACAQAVATLWADPAIKKRLRSQMRVIYSSPF